MTLLQLAYAVALDRHGHFGRAAEACHVTQPALSAGVQALEAGLGAVLFDRSAHPIVPTELGRAVVAQARHVLAEAERLEDLVSEATGELAGELRVGVLSTLAPYLVPLVIAPFARRYPDVELVFEELMAEAIVDHVRRDLLDAGLTATAPPVRGIEEVPLFEEPLVGYVAPGHRLYGRAEMEPEDLSPGDVWLMREGHCFRDQALALLARGAGRPDAKAAQFESGNLETLQRIVDRGFGMTLLPWLAVQGGGSHAPESVRPFRAPAPSRTVRLVYATTLVRRHLVRAFAAEVARAVAADLPPGAVLYTPGR
ncbi:LysR substrate-binding domain-containing protein [Rubrivirga litoralis]|uniref:LysR substrate-binding domain-containing protein n=1 Tax=Rubrivirga litoralis TaxID=3075598 RepID=A0ABU3BU09_9BACT|nr:LysR substrate-binding domain-containing protein [Rubrivirga sp. F394]MDT0632778.1 LysR substrate-binding domain-containing protein [Rubrivirga sp. F394]